MSPVIVEASVDLDCSAPSLEVEMTEKMAQLREELLGKLSEHLVAGKKFTITTVIHEEGEEVVLEYRAVEVGRG